MENQITCPNCKKKIFNNPLVNYAATGEGTGSQSFNCDCGERITYWAITAQLREQKKVSWRFRNWYQTFSQSRG